MTDSLVQELRDQIRGVTGALLVVGLTFHYTMETWWLGWTLPFPYLAGYAFVGLLLITLMMRVVGFHERERTSEDDRNPWQQVALDYAEVLMQSFVASYSILLLLGIIDLDSSFNVIVRLGFIEVVPLGFGAALANRVFGGKGGQQTAEGVFPHNLAIFTVGALFVASTIAPTQEIELIAVHMTWSRYVTLVVVTLVLVYLMLYELEFKGQQSRLSYPFSVQIGTVFTAYLVAVVVSFFLLLAFGHFIDASVPVVYQETVLLSFPAAMGAAAAEVLI